jgi:glycosyltransferase involved in cell wall biosynthesis
MGLKVLITNVVLAQYSGTETYTRDIALGLLERGHSPFVYTHRVAGPALDLRQATIPVVTDLGELTVRPDIIHGHHNLETLTALIRYRDVPAVYFVHDSTAWQDVPPIHPRILRYVAVDHNCRDRMILEYGVPEEKHVVLPNAVDLSKFRPRSPLPERPARALVFSNYAQEGPHLQAIRDACAECGLKLDVVGDGVNNGCSRPEEILGAYDIVFAKARCALEALATGCAVIVCDTKGAGPMVTSRDVDRLRELNFGRRALVNPVEAQVLVREIRRYDAEDAAKVASTMRDQAGLDLLVDTLAGMYEDVIEEFRTGHRADLQEEERAEAHFLAAVGQRLADYNRALWEVESYRNSAMMRLRNRLVRSPLLCRFVRRISS